MNTKKGILIGIFLLVAQFSNAQFQNIKGVAVQATSKLFVDNGEAKSEELDQIYMISFSDEFLGHGIYESGILSKSQFYKINTKTSSMDGDITIIKFNAVSGKTGNVFKYELKIDKDGKLISLVVTEPGDYKTTYKGGIVDLSTYKQ